MDSFVSNVAAEQIRFDCRDHYRSTGELESFKTYNGFEQSIWDDEAQQIQRDEAQSV